jgi:hypothetical protein
MLMTPWLAAGAGVVLAAALALHGPHAQLTYTPVNPGGACSAGICRAAPGSPGGADGTDAVPGQALSGTAPGRAVPRTGLRHARKVPAVGGHAPASGPALRVRYQTVQQWPGGFRALITLTGQAVRTGWQLSFRYPGATVDSVTGASWASHDGEVTVTSSPLPAAPAAGGVRIRLRASGTPSRPTGCSFDGVACIIHAR